MGNRLHPEAFTQSSFYTVVFMHNSADTFLQRVTGDISMDEAWLPFPSKEEKRNT